MNKQPDFNVKISFLWIQEIHKNNDIIIKIESNRERNNNVQIVDSFNMFLFLKKSEFDIKHNKIVKIYKYKWASEYNIEKNIEYIIGIIIKSDELTLSCVLSLNKFLTDKHSSKKDKGTAWTEKWIQLESMKFKQ